MRGAGRARGPRARRRPRGRGRASRTAAGRQSRQTAGSASSAAARASRASPPSAGTSAQARPVPRMRPRKAGCAAICVEGGAGAARGGVARPGPPTRPRRGSAACGPASASPATPGRSPRRRAPTGPSGGSSPRARASPGSRAGGAAGLRPGQRQAEEGPGVQDGRRGLPGAVALSLTSRREINKDEEIPALLNKVIGREASVLERTLALLRNIYLSISPYRHCGCRAPALTGR